MDQEIERARKLTRVLDHYLVDPILGFILPGVGDVIGSFLGLYLVGIALRRKMSPVIIARMLLNLGVDALVGIVPLLGDIADVAFHANERNLALLESSAARGGRATAKDWAVVALAAGAFIAAIALTLYLLGAAVHAIERL
jgi:uncharacterized protein DUF4112